MKDASAGGGKVLEWEVDICLLFLWRWKSLALMPQYHIVRCSATDAKQAMAQGQQGCIGSTTPDVMMREKLESKRVHGLSKNGDLTFSSCGVYVVVLRTVKSRWRFWLTSD